MEIRWRSYHLCNLIYLVHTYQSLDNEYSLLTVSTHKLIDVDGFLRLEALQHVVQW